MLAIFPSVKDEIGAERHLRGARSPIYLRTAL